MVPFNRLLSFFPIQYLDSRNIVVECFWCHIGVAFGFRGDAKSDSIQQRIFWIQEVDSKVVEDEKRKKRMLEIFGESMGRRQ